MKRRDVVLMLAVALLMLAGCATPGTGRAVTMTEDKTADACYEGHRLPPTITVAVYVDEAGAVQVVPERVVLEDPGQTVVWVAADGEISNIDFEPSACAPAPPSIPKRARLLSTRVPRGYSGTHKYSLTFHPREGESHRIDPLLVVEY